MPNSCAPAGPTHPPGADPDALPNAAGTGGMVEEVQDESDQDPPPPLTPPPLPQPPLLLPDQELVALSPASFLDPAYHGCPAPGPVAPSGGNDGGGGAPPPPLDCAVGIPAGNPVGIIPGAFAAAPKWGSVMLSPGSPGGDEPIPKGATGGPALAGRVPVMGMPIAGVGGKPPGFACGGDASGGTPSGANGGILNGDNEGVGAVKAASVPAVQGPALDTAAGAEFACATTAGAGTATGGFGTAATGGIRAGVGSGNGLPPLVCIKLANFSSAAESPASMRRCHPADPPPPI